MLAISMCHNVTPVYTRENGSEVKELQASSPDEVALVRFGDLLSMELVEREESRIVIRNSILQREEYEILANVPFSSETKRMGIILRHTKTSKIVLYVKGADTVMVNKIKP
jgi:phospholipid-translocating ATPase